MSWDVCIVKFENVYENVEDISNDDAEPLVLGAVEEIHRAISDVFTGTDWSDPAWGIWDGDDGSIEFNVGDGAETTSVMLHVRAG
ncbi:MAG: hypothetical protein LBD06_13290, partial [Candidatus Accumulibacter sp.]|nr:hypothetical protein [Accumulibacter sp.]